jgi:hypothetical protein
MMAGMHAELATNLAAMGDAVAGRSNIRLLDYLNFCRREN